MTVCLYLFTAWLCDDCVSVSVYSLTLWWPCVCICLQPDFVMTVFLYLFTAWLCDDCVPVSVLQPDFVMTVCLYLFYSLTLWWLCVCICLQPDFVMTVCLYLFTAWLCDDCVSVFVYSLTLWRACLSWALASPCWVWMTQRWDSSQGSFWPQTVSSSAFLPLDSWWKTDASPSKIF